MGFWPRVALIWGILGCCAPPAAWARPYQGAATATPGPKDRDPVKLRQQALRQARRAALESALPDLDTDLDRAAKRALLNHAEAWTGAYRILSERGQGRAVEIEVEVDIDLIRLRKHLLRPTSAGVQSLFELTQVTPAGTCIGGGDMAAQIRRAFHQAQASAAGGVPLEVRLQCVSLGAVPHTMLHAARVQLEARAQGRTVATAEAPGFAGDPQAAQGAALASAAADLGASLALRRRAVVRLQVAQAVPALTIARLERALVRSVQGVRSAHVAAVDGQGQVTLQVEGPGGAHDLAAALEAAEVPGVRIQTMTVEGPDVLAIRVE